MLIYVVLFLVSLAVATIAVAIFRAAFSKRGYNQSTVSNPGPTTKRWLQAQKSFNSLASSTHGHAKFVTLAKSKGGIKAPWGW